MVASVQNMVRLILIEINSHVISKPAVALFSTAHELLSHSILGLGFKKRNYMHFSKVTPAIQLMHQIKPIFDPKGILNPYKVLPDTEI